MIGDRFLEASSASGDPLSLPTSSRICSTALRDPKIDPTVRGRLAVREASKPLRQRRLARVNRSLPRHRGFLISLRSGRRIVKRRSYVVRKSPDRVRISFFPVREFARIDDPFRRHRLAPQAFGRRFLYGRLRSGGPAIGLNRLLAARTRTQSFPETAESGRR